jgi:hypothetical protein
VNRSAPERSHGDHAGEAGATGPVAGTRRATAPAVPDGLGCLPVWRRLAAHYWPHFLIQEEVELLRGGWSKIKRGLPDRFRPRPTAEEWQEAVRDKPTETARAHLIADGPVGAFLSGGVDSGAVGAPCAGTGGRS